MGCAISAIPYLTQRTAFDEVMQDMQAQLTAGAQNLQLFQPPSLQTFCVSLRRTG